MIAALMSLSSWQHMIGELRPRYHAYETPASPSGLP